MTDRTRKNEHIIQEINKNRDDLPDSAISVICMNLVEHKYYVYDTNGML